MKKINILVTAVGGDIGSNIINILTKQKNININININIIGTDISKFVFCYEYLDTFYKISKASSNNYKKDILNIITNNSIDIIIPVSENEILWFNDNINIFNKLNIKVLINNKNIIDSFFDKFKTSIVLNNILVKTPKTYLFHTYNNNLEFPIILKSKYSIFSKEIYIIKEQTQLSYLKQLIKNKENYIIQEYIGTIDEEYTTCIYKYQEKIKIITFKRKLDYGMTTFATIVDEKILYNYANKIAKSINLNGSINIQSRKYNGDFYIFEINPRFSSTIYIRDKFNFSDLLWWINDLYKNDLFKLKNNIAKSGHAILGHNYKFIKGNKIDE